jgi:hypothetical protein
MTTTKADGILGLACDRDKQVTRFNDINRCKIESNQAGIYVYHFVE